jgi:hypothetical protein
MEKIVKKLAEVRKKTIRWEKNKKKTMQVELIKIEEEIVNLYLNNVAGVFTRMEMAKMEALRNRKAEILLIDEET